MYAQPQTLLLYYVKLSQSTFYNSLVVNGRNVKVTVLRGNVSLLSQFKYMNESVKESGEMALAGNYDRRAVTSLMYEAVGVTEVVGKGELLDNISLRTGFTDLTVVK